MTRTLPASLAPIVEALELDAANVVTTSELAALAREAGVGTDAYVIATRLASLGWLLRTDVHGVWEFSPGAHAGAISRGDPFLQLRAQLATNRRLDVRIGLESAMWRHGLVDRAPEKHVLTVRDKKHAPAALRRTYRVTSFDAELRPAWIGDLPTEAPATLLVHFAVRPTDVRNWGLALDGLRALVEEADAADVHAEARKRTNATRARLAYLIAPFDPMLAESLGVIDKGVVWFGPRGSVRRSDARWNVVDTVLPRSPGQVARSP